MKTDDIIDAEFTYESSGSLDLVSIVQGLVQHFTQVEQATDVDILTAQDAAAMLGCSQRHIYNLANAGEIPHVRLGDNMLRFRRSTLAAWMTAREKESMHAVSARQRLVHRLPTSRSPDGAPPSIPAVSWEESEDEEGG